MSNVYEPDRWIVFGVPYNGKTLYKVLGGWMGGYLDGDYWRANSGIKAVEFDGDYYLFHGYSGSIYRCHKDGYGITYLMSTVISNIEKGGGFVLNESEDFLNLKIEDLDS